VIDQVFRAKVGTVWLNFVQASTLLENTWPEIEYLVDILRAADGTHVEMY
jgi:hypothetical protein